MKKPCQTATGLQNGCAVNDLVETGQGWAVARRLFSGGGFDIGSGFVQQTLETLWSGAPDHSSHMQRRFPPDPDARWAA